MSQFEAYYDGLYAGDDIINSEVGVPPWAKSMGFCNAGCYVYVDQDALIKACPLLNRMVEGLMPAYMELSPVPRTNNAYGAFFRDLETKDINILSDCDNITLECFGAAMSHDTQGKTILTGRFRLQGELGDEKLDVSTNIRGTLVLSTKQGTHTTVTLTGVVGYFKVPAKLTMDPEMFTDHWAATASSSNPLFGFFEHTQKAKEKNVAKAQYKFFKMLDKT